MHVSFGNLNLDLHNYARLLTFHSPLPALCAFIFNKSSSFLGMKLFKLIGWGQPTVGCVIAERGWGRGRERLLLGQHGGFGVDSL